MCLVCNNNNGPEPGWLHGCECGQGQPEWRTDWLDGNSDVSGSGSADSSVSRTMLVPFDASTGEAYRAGRAIARLVSHSTLHRKLFHLIPPMSCKVN